MANYNPNSFKYVLQDESVSKVCREVHVSFKLGKNTYRTFVFIPKKEGQVSKSYYIDEAKKEIDRQIKSGELVKNAKLLDKKHPYLLRNVLVAASILAVVGAVVGGTYPLWNKGGEPEPQPQPVVHTFNVVHHLMNKEGNENSYIFRGPGVVEEGKTYTCNIELKDEFKSTHEINNLKIVMNGEDLKAADYDFIPTAPGLFDLNIKKPATGNIGIIGTIQDNTFNVYCSCVGCKWTSDGTSDPIKTASKNGVYSCYIKTEDDDYLPTIYGITMGNSALVNNDDYTFDQSTGRLDITKKINGNLHIVSGAIEKTPTVIPVYHGSYGGCIVENKPLANVGQNYTCTVQTEDTTNQFPQIVSVSIDGKTIREGADKDYTFEKALTSEIYTLTIKSNLITSSIKEIYFSVIALNKPTTTAKVAFSGGDTCTSDGEGTAELNNSYSCKITPVNPEHEVRIVSVVMNGAIYSAYTWNPTATGDNFSIEKVTGDISIVAIAQEKASTAHAVAVMYDSTECEVTDYSPTVTHEGTYSCKITPKKDTEQIRIPFITMGGIKVDPDSDTGFKFNRNDGVLTINKPAVGDIVIVAIAEAKEKSKFLIDSYCFEVTFDGDSEFTPGADPSKDYTATITANDPTKHIPKILQIKINGVDCTNEYSLVAPATGDAYTLTIPNDKVVGDVFIALSVTDKARSFFNVTVYNYMCNFEGEVSVGVNEKYQATVTSEDEDYTPYVYKVTMGSSGLVEGVDYEFDIYGTENNLKINKKAEGDIVICATVRSRTDYIGTPTFTYDSAGKTAEVTGVTTPAEYGIEDVTDITIPSKVVSGSDEYTITSIKETGADGKGILYGFSNLERLTIPFVGRKLNYNSNDTQDDYDKLFGYLFGTRLFDKCGNLTWQTFYLNEEETTDSYRITRASIPTSLSTVTVLGGDIAPGAFSACENINKIEFKNCNESNTSIGAYAFYNCKKLRTVKMPSNSKVTTINWRAFEGCIALETFTLTSITTIKHHAFADCSGITNIYLPVVGKLSSVGSGAFSGIDGVIACESTRSEIKNKIGSGWASDWSDIDAAIVYGYYDDKMIIAEDAPDYKFIRIRKDDGKATPTYGASIVEYLGSDHVTSYSIPATLKGPAIDGNGSQDYPVLEINAQVFYGYTLLEEVDFTNAINLEYIGDFAFTSCTSLKSLKNFDKAVNLKSIGNYAFDRCLLPDGISLPSGVSEIGNFAFGYSSLPSINLSQTNVTKISDNLFYQCASLTTVTLKTAATYTYLGKNAFDGCSNLASLSISATNVVTEIPDYFCNGCSKLSTFKLTGASLTRIGNYAFNGCSVMKTWNTSGTDNHLPNSVTTIGDYALAGWIGSGSLASFTIDKGSKLTTVGVKIINGWTTSKTLNIDESLVDDCGIYVEQSNTNWGWTMARNQGIGDRVYYTYYCTAGGNSKDMPIWIMH